MNDSLPELQKVEYASFNQRSLASIIDTLLVLLFLSPIFRALGHFFSRGYDVEGFIEKISVPGLLPDELLALCHDFFIAQGFLYAWTYNNLAQFLILGAVFAVFWYKWNATPGKMLFRMKIVDERTHQPPSQGQYMLRYVGYIVSIIPFMLGFLWVLWDKKCQGFHDKIASTVVIRLPKASP